MTPSPKTGVRLLLTSTSTTCLGRDGSTAWDKGAGGWYSFTVQSFAESKRVRDFTKEFLAKFGIPRGVKQRALKNLEDAGLIRVSQVTGHSSRITLMKI